MCWSCNPYCGGCKPPKERPVRCRTCKTFNFRDESNKCKNCGAVLPDPIKRPTVMCLQIGKLCANPCNRHKSAPDDGVLKTCNLHTPPKEEIPTEKPHSIAPCDP